MRTLLIKTKIKFTLFSCFLLVSSLSYSKTIARVSNIKGNAFLFDAKGSSKSLKVGDHIKDLNEVMVEESGQLSFVNYDEHMYHLSGGTHLKFFNKIMDLQSGYIWGDSTNKGSGSYAIQSPNGLVNFSKGEFIFSYDQNTNKTQVLVLDGEIEFANLQETYLNVAINSGKFSIIDPEVEQGIPRTPIMIGFSSYKEMLALFDVAPRNNTLEKVIAMKDDTNAHHSLSSRSIASVKDDDKLGKIIFVKTTLESSQARIPASIAPSAVEYYKEHHKSSPVKKAVKTAQVKIYGQNGETNHKKVEAIVVREPASVVPQKSIIKDIENAFDKSLDAQLKEQKRHPEEVNQLINELNSFDVNFQQNY